MMRLVLNDKSFYINPEHVYAISIVPIESDGLKYNVEMRTVVGVIVLTTVADQAHAESIAREAANLWERSIRLIRR